MTAAPSSERRPIRTRALAAVVSAGVAWTPWAMVWGDAFNASAAFGQATGTGARAAVPLPATAGQSVVLPGGAGGNLDFGALFPGSGGGAPANFASHYSRHEAVMIRGQEAQINLLSASSPTGEAYRALRSSVDRSHPDMRADPTWFQTDDVLDHFGEVTDLFGHCTTNTTFVNSQRQAHITDYRTCDRLVEQGGICSWYHDYTLPDARPLSVSASGNATVTSCGNDCARVTLTRQEGDAMSLSARIEIGDPGRVIRVSASLTVGDPPWPEEPPIPEGFEPAGETAFWWAKFGDRTLLSNRSPPDALKDEDITEELRSGGGIGVVAEKFFHVKNANCDRDALVCPPPQIHAVVPPGIDLSIDIHFRVVTEPDRSVWGPNDGCYDLLEAVTSGSCPGTVECLGAPPLAASGCYEAPGVRICPSALRPPPVAGQNPFCKEIRVSADCASRHIGQMECWMDPQGERHCPYNSGGQPSDCQELEQNPNCGFVSSQCVEGATDARGDCWLFTETWDCGSMHPVPVLERLQSGDCAGPVRCMGTNCASFPSETSTDFGKAVAALQAVQMAVTDMQCTPGGECLVFAGEANECKRAVGGVVNCCKTPEGISLGDYINLIFAIGKVDSAILGMNKGSVIRGSWETLRQPVTWTWNTIKESWTSVANNLMGNTTASASDAATRIGLDAVKQALLKQTAEWAAQIFGDAAVNALFSTTTGAPAVVGGVVTDGSVLQLGGGGAWLGTAMAWAMYAYMIYAVVMVLIKIIWTCEKEEFELGAKRELRSCHGVGGYCKSKVLGVCVERRDSYCCFNTPFSRIINEQVRPQLGRDWGAPKTPDCQGISVRDLARVDWSQVNLDEWLSILLESGHFPTAPTLTMDNLTGSGSELAIKSQGRADAATRTAQRAQGLDSQQRRQEAQGELWGGVLSTLPAR